MVTVQYSTAGLMTVAKKSLIGLLLFIGVASASHCNQGCRPVSYADTEAAYTAELVHCSTVAKTKAEAKACRFAVNTKYGLCQGDWPRITPCDE